ncbi:peptidase M61 [Sandaracinobacter sp. RS1-74]|uniref:peptidase M61 n=1 Tax=Sandaracinobacteroides sayramensis TaxID=2913411 RepID=UPI001EDAE4CB|nr:peptidase M61 [Sandaracinobacteroides sayramensis]MCG2842079.1 peptidase M61 [Sandaracinobacteroides sayramensis]
MNRTLKAFTLLALVPLQPALAAERTLALTLAPEGRAQVETLIVSMAFGGVGAKAGEPLLQLPLVASNVDTVATTLTGLEARDDLGPLPLSARNIDLPEENARDAVAGGPSRQWLAGRGTQGAIHVRYAVPAHATLPPRGPAPPFAFSNDGGATSAAGHVFLLLPPGAGRYRATIDWDLSAAPAGSRGISSLGEGRVQSSEPLSPSELRMGFYMGGPIGAWPATPPRSGFFSAWQGSPPFDAEELMQWTGRLHAHYARFFRQAEPPPYGVFLRYNPVNAGGGVGLHHSFVTTFGKPGGQGSDPQELKFTLAHEMFHTFQPFLDEPGGLASSWFGEGLATFYQSRLPLKFGMVTPDDFLADINSTAGRYYTSVMARVPNSEIASRFWADTRIRTLPYDRGMLYFATVEEAVRAASGGKRSLDDLTLEMLAQHHSGAKLTPDSWEALLRREVGEAEALRFRAFLQGEMPIPGHAAFGPCFRRTTKPLRRYELGFDSAVLAEPSRIVRGLVPGSAAARAGLRDGDEIVAPVPQDAIQGDQQARLHLQIRRAERSFPLSYLPRGETVEAIQWERVPGFSGTDCAL